MKFAIFADCHCFGKIAVLVKESPIVRCPVGCKLSAGVSSHTMTVGHEMGGPSKWIPPPVVLHFASNGALAVRVSLYACANPARCGNAISGEERNKWSTRQLNAQVSSRTNMYALLDEYDRLQVLPECIEDVPAARVHDNDLRSGILLNK